MDRYTELREAARSLGVDAVALVPGPNFVRVMRKDFSTSERPTLVVIPVEGKPAAIIPNLELGSWAPVGFEGETFDWKDQTGYQDAFDALARHMPLKSLAVEGQGMRVFVHHALVKAYPGLTIIDGHKKISGLRLRKTPEEIKTLERAIEISETALAEVFDLVRVGMTEKDIESALLLAQFRHGGEDLAFTPIVAAGENSAKPHAHARDYPVQAGDALLIDFGARWGGFASDITRTAFVGHAGDEQQAVYDAVLRANLKGHEVTRAGVTAHEVDDAVIGVLEASGWPERIRTKTGHGLGREVHEEPYIMRGNHQVLEPGMVFTCEPGLYEIGNFGVRIEDDLLVTETGCRSLTTFPRDLRIVG